MEHNLFGAFEENSDYFFSREKELSALNVAFFENNSKVVLITGGPGTGKTAIALEFARLHKNQFPGGIYHLPPLASVDVFKQVLAFVHESSEPMLIIFELDESIRHERIAQLLPALQKQRPSAKILLTSRFTSIPILSPSWGLVDFVVSLGFGNSIGSTIYEDVQPFNRPSIIGIDGHPISKNSKFYKQIVIDISEVDEELLKRLSNDPHLLNELSPRKFEEVIAEILLRQGYEVQITPFSKDGGKDICAAKKEALGSFLYIVQCKKYAPNRPVGVEVVRELYGVVQVEKATAGIVATTSHFTKGAKDLQSQLSYQMSLKDYVDVQEWLRSALRRKSTI